MRNPVNRTPNPGLARSNAWREYYALGSSGCAFTPTARSVKLGERRRAVGVNESACSRRIPSNSVCLRFHKTKSQRRAIRDVKTRTILGVRALRVFLPATVKTPHAYAGPANRNANSCLTIPSYLDGFRCAVARDHRIQRSPRRVFPRRRWQRSHDCTGQPTSSGDVRHWQVSSFTGANLGHHMIWAVRC